MMTHHRFDYREPRGRDSIAAKISDLRDQFQRDLNEKIWKSEL